MVEAQNIQWKLCVSDLKAKQSREGVVSRRLWKLNLPCNIQFIIR